MVADFYQDFDFDTYSSPHQGARQGDSRNVFQRDRDRVIFSYAFRRLQSKTQVFQSGEYDFYRTRLTHSLEVARIAKSIGERLNKQYADEIAIDGDLLEAVGLSHDLGHPPFGHIGERKLNELMAPWGGFEGNAQTARILTETFWIRQQQPSGMNPSRAFLDGVMKYKALWSECFDTDSPDSGPPENHFIYDTQSDLREYISGGSWPRELTTPEMSNASKSLECQIMDWADDTAYSLHDIVDGVKAGYLTTLRIKAWASGQQLSSLESVVLCELLEAIDSDTLERDVAVKIGKFINAADLSPRTNYLSTRTKRHCWQVTVPVEMKAECGLYKRIALDLVFRSARIQQVEHKSGFLLERMFNALFESHLSPRSKGLRLLPEPTLGWLAQHEDEPVRARLICDYLAQLTDHEAIRLYRRLFDPDFGSITDLL